MLQYSWDYINDLLKLQSQTTCVTADFLIAKKLLFLPTRKIGWFFFFFFFFSIVIFRLFVGRI